MINVKIGYKEAIRKSESIKNLGIEEIYLTSDFPWTLATDCSPGGSHRLEISTSVWFYATEPNTGLKFRWSFDIEPHSANGSGKYCIDVDGVEKIISVLPDKAKKQFLEYLKDCASKVQKNADEYKKIASEQQTLATNLNKLSNLRSTDK